MPTLFYIVIFICNFLVVILAYSFPVKPKSENENITALTFIVLGRNMCYDVKEKPFQLRTLSPTTTFNVSSPPPIPTCIEVYEGCEGCTGSHDLIRGRMVSSGELKARLRQVMAESWDYSLYLKTCYEDEPFEEKPWIFVLPDINTSKDEIEAHIAQHYTASASPQVLIQGMSFILLFLFAKLILF